MAVATDTTINGFRPEAVEFLAELAANNERAWFQPRKAEYERLLKEPLEALCIALEERFRERGIPLRADPTKSPFRIYRDVRFAKDKSPYKTNIGASFAWHLRRPKAHRPTRSGPPTRGRSRPSSSTSRSAGWRRSPSARSNSTTRSR